MFGMSAGRVLIVHFVEPEPLPWIPSQVALVSQRIVEIGGAPLEHRPASASALVRAPDDAGVSWRWVLDRMGAFAARRRLARLEQETRAEVTLLHVWSDLLVDQVARLLAPHRRLVVRVCNPKWLTQSCRRPLLANPRSTWLCDSENSRSRLLEAGARVSHCHVVRDGVRPTDTKRDWARTRLGLQPQHAAILLLPPLGMRRGAFTSLWATLLLEKVRPEIRVLLPGGLEETRRLHSLARAARHEHLIQFPGADAPLEMLAAASDLAVCVGDEDLPLGGVATSMLHGAPLVASRSRSVCEVLEDGRTARLCESTPRSAAAAMLEVIEQTGRARKLADEAQQVGTRMFSADIFLDAHREIYSLAARPAY